MSSENPQDVKPMVANYKKLFLILSVVTLVGIGIAVLHVPVWFVILVGVALIFAKSVIVYEFFKKLLVGRNFMFLLFFFTITTVIGLLFLPVLNHADYIVGTEDISKHILMEQKEAGHGGH